METQKTGMMRWFLPAELVFAAGFAVATGWDLAIDQALYSPQNTFAVMMECFGWYPAFLPAVALLAALALLPVLAVRKKAAKVACAAWAGVLSTAGFAVLLYVSLGNLAERGWLGEDFGGKIWFLLVASALLAVILVTLLWPHSKRTQAKLLLFTLMGSVYLVLNQGLITLLKEIWDRTRFDDMVAAGSFADFTVWFHPFGNGGTSFPSGHTANAAGIFVLIILCDLFLSWNKRRNVVYGICWGAIALMAFSRVLIGRHFLSDTLAGAAIMALVFFALRRLGPYRRAARALRDAPAESDADASANAFGIFTAAFRRQPPSKTSAPAAQENSGEDV